MGRRRPGPAAALAGVIGLAAASWAVFALALVITIACGLIADDIRPGRGGRR